MGSDLLDRLRVWAADGEEFLGVAAGEPAGHPQVRGGKYVRGPLDWLQVAGRQRGRALHVALVVCYLSSLRRHKTISLSMSACAAFGLDRFAVHRALNALELAGLVTVDRGAGCLPLVTILPVPTAKGAGQ